MTKLSVILPCYNEGENIPLILERYSQVAKRVPMELVLVDNGSTDGTEGILRKELPKYKFARSVKVGKNIGYGFGILSGLRTAKSGYLAFSHADMQCDPRDIEKGWKILISSVSPERTLVKGNREGRANFFTSCFHAASSAVLMKHFDDVNGQPKIFHKDLLGMMKKPPNGFSLDLYVQYTALRNGFAVRSFPVKFKRRLHGKSSWATGIRSRAKTIAGMSAYILKLRMGL